MLNQLKTWARSIKRDALAIYLAGRDPTTPWYVKALALCIAGYAFSPIDLIPDFIPVLGLLDEAILLPLAILGVAKLIPAADFARFRAEADAIAERPTSRLAAAIIVLVWLVAFASSAWLGYRYLAASDI